VFAGPFLFGERQIVGDNVDLGCELIRNWTAAVECQLDEEGGPDFFRLGNLCDISALTIPIPKNSATWPNINPINPKESILLERETMIDRHVQRNLEAPSRSAAL